MLWRISCYKKITAFALSMAQQAEVQMKGTIELIVFAWQLHCVYHCEACKYDTVLTLLAGFIYVKMWKSFETM